MMNELIVKLYDQALVLESNGDYVAGELDPVKFAELIVRECIGMVLPYNEDDPSAEKLYELADAIGEHFGVEK